MKQKIIKPAPFEFKAFWDTKELMKIVVELNFKPLIEAYSLSGSFVLFHWQNKPVNFRRWGVYDGLTDQYYGVDADKVTNTATTPGKPLQISERIHFTRPTAVWLIPNAISVYSGEEILIKNEELKENEES